MKKLDTDLSTGKSLCKHLHTLKMLSVYLLSTLISPIRSKPVSASPLIRPIHESFLLLASCFTPTTSLYLEAELLK